MPAFNADEGFWSRCDLNPDKPAVVDVDGRAVSFAEMEAEVNQISHLLQDIGVGPGDHVAFLLRNRLEVFELALGCAQIGAYHTPINRHLAVPEVQHVIRDSGAKVLVTEEKLAGLASRSLDGTELAVERFAIGSINGFRPFREMISDRPTDRPTNRSPGWPFLYTSGTTGVPKAIKRPRPPDIATLVTWSRALSDLWGWDGDEVHLLQGPHYHGGPYSCSTSVLHLGGTVVIVDKWDAADVLSVIEKHRVTSTFMVPTMLVKLLRLDEEVRHRADVSSLKHDGIVLSAAICPPEVKEAMTTWWGPVFKEVYGGTEGSFTTISAAEAALHPGSVGRPIPGVEIAVLDEEGTPCASNEVGTIYARLPDAFEYFNAPEKTARSRRGDLITLGDMGYQDPDGWLHVVDRRDDLIVKSGTNIYPAEIEAVLLQHPRVVDAVVVPVAHDTWGQEPVALVQTDLVGGDVDDLPKELTDFLAERVSRFKLPARIEVRASLPRTPAGKIMRRQVRLEMSEEGVPQ